MSVMHGTRRWRPVAVIAPLLAVMVAVPVVPSPAVGADRPPASPGTSHDVSPDLGLIWPLGSSDGLAVDGQRLLVFTGRAGFRRSANHGRLWHRAMSGYVTSSGTEPWGEALCQAPSAPAVVYSPGTALETGELRSDVFRSDDFGGRWRRLATVENPDAALTDCAVHPVDPERVYLLAGFADFDFPEPLFRSTDGGRTFDRLGSGLEGMALSGLRILPTRPETLWVIGDGSIYASTDGGHSFDPLPGGPDRVERIFPHPTRDGLVFVDPGAPVGAEYRLLRSTDGGASFAPVGPVRTRAVAVGMTMAFDPADPNVVYAVLDPHGLYRSLDFGATFERLPGPAAGQVGPFGIMGLAVTMSPDGRRHLYVAGERGPHRSDDGGRTFVPVTETFRAASVNDLVVDATGRLMVAVMHTVLAFRARTPGHPADYDAVGEAITARPVDESSALFSAVAMATSTVDVDRAMLVTVDKGVFVTTDASGTWIESALPDPLLPAVGWQFFTRTQAAFAPGSATRAYITSGRLRGLLRSDDGGRSFELVLTDAIIRAFAIDARDPDVVYLAGFLLSTFDDAVIKSVDGGRTFVTLGVSDAVSAIALDAVDGSTLYAVRRDGGILRSRDGGTHWQDANAGLPVGLTLAIASDPNVGGRVYAWIRSGGLFVSTDHGSTWQAADTGEARRRSGVEIGRAAMVVDPRVPGRVYLGNSGVIQVDTMGARRR